MFLMKCGSRKLPKDYMISNMGPANICPAKVRGLCLVCNQYGKCYAEDDEIQYPAPRPYRVKQMTYWLRNDAETIWQDIDKQLSRKRKLPSHFRFNESGDFWKQACIEKLDYIAGKLKDKYGIITYGYTARADLDFSGVKNFLVKGSGHKGGNNGETRVFPKKGDIPEGWFTCPGSCKACDMCTKKNGQDVAFIKH